MQVDLHKILGEKYSKSTLEAVCVEVGLRRLVHLGTPIDEAMKNT